MTDDREKTERLLSSAREGDQQALMQLLFQFHHPLLAHIQANLGNRLAMAVSAEDVLQETFVQALRGIGQQRHDNAESFLAWLKTIAANRLRDAARGENCKKRGGDFARVQARNDPFRSQAKDLLAELSGDLSTPSRVVARAEAVDAMQVAISVLPDDQREALRLHYFERRTLEETAAAMGRSPGSIRGLIQRAKQQLRDHLDSASKWFSE